MSEKSKQIPNIFYLSGNPIVAEKSVAPDGLNPTASEQFDEAVNNALWYTSGDKLVDQARCGCQQCILQAQQTADFISNATDFEEVVLLKVAKRGFSAWQDLQNSYFKRT